ncbi:hypothetical protein M2347_000439 [Chryseobacterium sp. H1D6B]|uniref:hypothetical protein n=1 Tax=Chryseobacterium sp. H1D6B TaxID=2940588 RepID=UPI0015C82F15|nr:hypothetical protein [Chryseobacterium sp. H1D6B]MDH6250712.1 hypothetical protein [Chryseobacterium sp. H1D6B]
MKKAYYLVLFISVLNYAQVGININNPTSTLTVNGSLEADYKQITAAAYPITGTDHYLTYNGTTASTFTLPVIGTGTTSYTGRIYKIKNISTFNITLQASSGNTLRVDNSPAATFIIPPGVYAEVVNNANTTGGTWDLSFSSYPKTNNVEIYGTQLLIPPHGNGTGNVADWSNHTNTAFDTGTGTDGWWVISKTSFVNAHTATYHNASRMTLVYEYQGTPFNLTNMYPLLTAGNNSSFPDVFTSSFVSLANNGTAGRTRLTVSVARIDFVGNNGSNSSEWAGTFLLNILLARKLN